VNTKNAGNKIGELIVALTRIDVDKIVELTVVLIDDAGIGEDNSVTKEVIDNSVDEVLSTSIIDTWRWEVDGED
jgi:hypothetical protein